MVVVFCCLRAKKNDPDRYSPGPSLFKDDDEFGEYERKTWEQILEADADRQMLRFALCSRVLTEEEMDRVLREGVHLFTGPGEAYRPLDKHLEMQNALEIQGRLRILSLRKTTGEI